MVGKENPHAGQGPVVLDIGGDVGALVVVMPAGMEDLEVEIIPTGTDARPSSPGGEHSPHDHLSSEHPSGGTGEHGHAHDIGSPPAPPHVAVVARPTPSGSVVHSLVYSCVPQGTYDLYVRPSGPVHLTATVVGGRVTQTEWES